MLRMQVHSEEDVHMIGVSVVYVFGSHSEIAYKMVEALVLIFCSPQLVVAFLHPGFRVLVEPGLAQWFVD